MSSPEELRSRARQLRDEARYLTREAENLRYLAAAEDRKEAEQAKLSHESAERAEAEIRRRREQEQGRGDNRGW